MTKQYNNAQELYNDLVKSPQPKGRFAEYMVKEGKTSKNLTSEKHMNFIPTNNKDYMKNGKKHRFPQYTKDSGITMKYSLWSATECDTHIQFLRDTQVQWSSIKYFDKCNDIIVLLNNHVGDFNYAVLDVDSKEELYNLYKQGFPIFDTPFTLSANRKLPHFFVKSEDTIPHTIGDRNKEGEQREIDCLTTWTFEKFSNKMYVGENSKEKDIPLYTKEELEKFLNWKFKGVGVDFSKKRDEHYTKNVGKKANCKANIETSEIYGIDMGDIIIKPTWETIPFEDLQELLNTIDPNDYMSYAGYKKLYRCIIAMLTEHSNVNDYIKLLTDFYGRTDKGKENKICWKNELYKDFQSVFNQGCFKFNVGNLTASCWLYEELFKKERSVWIKLAFAKHRQIDAIIFARLWIEEATEIFNERVGFIGGGFNQYVEYDADQETFIFHKKEGLKEEYCNLYCNIKITKQVQGQEIQLEKSICFINAWITSKFRKTYRGCVFNPPPKSAKDNKFNLFTGYDIDNITEYDDKVNDMTKQELEKELGFLLQHLRYLSGEDKTKEVYEFNLKFFAHLLKFPAVLPRICVVMLSVPGVGKNQFYNFIQNIIGRKYTYCSANAKDVIGDFNDQARAKLMICLNEFKNGHAFMEALKELVSDEIINTREKHKNSLKVNNFARILMFSNTKNPFNVEFRARRWVIMRCNPITASDEFRYERNYGGELADNVNSIFLQKCFLRYCREFVNVDKNYNFEINRPITEEYLHLRQRNIPYIVRFIKWYYFKMLEDKDKKFTSNKYSAKEMYDRFCEYTFDEGENGLKEISKSNFINDLDKYTIDKKKFNGLQEEMEYTKNNNEKVFYLPTNQKQKYYVLNKHLCKEYLDWENINTELDGKEEVEQKPEYNFHCESDSEEDSDSDSEEE